jgi:hypothetical protein
MARSSGFGTVPTWRRVCDVVAIRGKADVTLKRRHFRESDPFRKSRFLMNSRCHVLLWLTMLTTTPS